MWNTLSVCCDNKRNNKKDPAAALRTHVRLTARFILKWIAWRDSDCVWFVLDFISGFSHSRSTWVPPKKKNGGQDCLDLWTLPLAQLDLINRIFHGKYIQVVQDRHPAAAHPVPRGTALSIVRRFHESAQSAVKNSNGCFPRCFY